MPPDPPGKEGLPKQYPPVMLNYPPVPNFIETPADALGLPGGGGMLKFRFHRRISKRKESEKPSFLHLHHRKAKTFNHFEYFRADSTAFCPQKIGIYCEICGKNSFYKQSLIDNKQMDFLMISISARFLRC